MEAVPRRLNKYKNHAFPGNLTTAVFAERRAMEGGDMRHTRWVGGRNVKGMRGYKNVSRTSYNII